MNSPSSNEDQPRLKFLCSFNGSILPRPVDGKLRYVGGETRIVSVPRDIGFDELMGKMKELFDGVSVLKYQQPDEDLDALVSVVNDDDVVNMMEEYEKLGSGDGFTRIRIFLFSGVEQDHDSMCFVERDNERRYVDALNSHNDVLVDDYNQLNVDDNVHIPMPPVNLQQVRIPHHQSPNHRYSDMEPPWSPVYYSPNSPSSLHYHTPYGDPVDVGFDRGHPEDYFRQQNVSHQPQYDQQFPIPEHVAGFPGNLLHGSYQVNSPCVECPPRSFYNMNVNVGHPAYPDSNHVTSHYVHHEDRSRYIRHGAEFGNEIFHDQAMATGFSNGYGAENLYHASPRGHVPANALWRNGQSPIHGHPSYEASGVLQQENGVFNLGLVRTTLPVGVENQTQHHFPTEPVQITPSPLQFSPETVPFTPDPVQFTQPTSDPVQFSPAVIKSFPEPVNTETRKFSSSIKDGLGIENLNSPAKHIVGAENSDKESAPGPALKNKEFVVEVLNHVPQPPIESVKKTEFAEVKEEAEENSASATMNDPNVKEETVQEPDTVEAPVDLELESGSDTQSNTKIEPTKAEEEAIARGLQTIKNDDLEEVRELGSGTYGAVFHGKWKGSDVAIKRIKASCFAGRPSERERLIADFWKEALILSSLHHPNVVSFYGIVRDGPDGSLATVTEFMVNGSLKQFLRKKDRTIDRRKRLIIAMDASFGMEYLHGKNIVHFDLKCENLLVNMRDPHRPICKIGDLGLSKVKQHTLVSGGVRGTLPWMAPELLSGKSNMVSEKIDVYSFGIVMWELLTGDEPYGDMHCASIIGGIVNNSLRPTIPTWCDPEWKALMESCWSADPAERPSFSEVSQKLRNMAAGSNIK
ncbi:hypothetical protein QVD17_27531 [Tagetes erecta]|uniref:Protein kinase domain-containing protein n=1 Tax=Tagetes erecta TaxID=13708 RepID=A0AAD8K8U9_TARER|nr:hypothetical protein QVD17_27531 [Tagetes erecta]